MTDPSARAGGCVKLQAGKVSQSDLYAKIAIALRSPETIVFVDTSMLFWLYKLGRRARVEFFDWVRADLKGRFFIPVWSAHEIQRHLVNDQASLTPIIKQRKTLIAALKEMTALTSLHVDDDFPHEKYADRSAYLAELDRSTKELIEITGLSGIKPDWEKISEDVVPFVNEHILTSNIFPFLPSIREEFTARVEGRIPPGFRDDKTKKDNKFGDLMIWREIVECCVNTPAARNVVLLSNDIKDDWVYRPPTIIDAQGDRKSNQEAYETILTSPLLAHELLTASAVEDFHILNATSLSVVLERYDVRPCPRLFSAVQPLLPDNPPPAKASKSKRGPATGAGVEGDGRAPLQGGAALASDQAHGSAGAAKILLSELLAASSKLGAAAASLIEQIGAQDPSTQEAAVEGVPGMASLPETTDAERFAIGRALARATGVGLQAASNLIRRLARSGIISDPTREVLFAGAIYGLYFDDDQSYRAVPNTLDSEVILGVSEQPDMADAVRLTVEALASRQNKYLLLPSIGGPPDPVSLELIVDARALKGKDELLQILHNEVQLLEDLEPGDTDTLNARLGVDGTATAAEVLRAVAKRYGVRRNWLRISKAATAKLAWIETRGFRNL